MTLTDAQTLKKGERVVWIDDTLGTVDELNHSGFFIKWDDETLRTFVNVTHNEGYLKNIKRLNTMTFLVGQMVLIQTHKHTKAELAVVPGHSPNFFVTGDGTTHTSHFGAVGVPWLFVTTFGHVIILHRFHEYCPPPPTDYYRTFGEDFITAYSFLENAIEAFPNALIYYETTKEFKRSDYFSPPFPVTLCDIFKKYAKIP